MFDSLKWLGYTTVLLVLAVDVPATEAQPVASSLEQLRTLVRVGDEVTVGDVQGRELRGVIAEVTSSSLGLVVGGNRIDFPATDLDTVSRRDSRWSGTLWGLAVGGALGIYIEKGLAGEYGRDDVGYGSLVVPLAALGAGLGFATDAMIKGRQVVYARPASSTKGLIVSPVWSLQHKAIYVSRRF